MKKVFYSLFLFSVLFQTQAAIDTTAVFSVLPTVVEDLNLITVSFSVSASTDVDVAILDGNGKIIRHLAAGVLGGVNPPPVPLVAGFSQSVSWDLLDDKGQPASNAPFSVRVRAGMKPEWKFSINTANLPYSASRAGMPIRPKFWEDSILITNPVFARIAGSPISLYMAYNKETDELYVRGNQIGGIIYNRFSGITGESLGVANFGNHFRLVWGDLAFSNDGAMAYHQTGLDTLYRYTARGMATRWPVNGNWELPDFWQGFAQSRGLASGPNNHMYVLHHTPAGWEHGTVTEITDSGEIVKQGLVTIDATVHGIRVDPFGNIFIGAHVKPLGQPLPPGLSMTVDESLRSLYWWAEEMYGGLFKFPPTGGSLTASSTGSLVYNRSNDKVTPTNLLWWYYGLSPVVTHYMEPAGQDCICATNRFDIDGFGRVFLPDAFRISVVVLDNNGNEITRFNHKNVPISAAIPSIGFANLVNVSDHAFYAGDWVNNQVMGVSIKARNEAVIPLATGVDKSPYLIDRIGFVIYGKGPNPFSAAAEIRYHVPDGKGAMPVRAAVYDATQRLVRVLESGEKGAGDFSVSWNGTDKSGKRVADGIYFCRITCGKEIRQARMMLLR